MHRAGIVGHQAVTAPQPLDHAGQGQLAGQIQAAGPGRPRDHLTERTIASIPQDHHAE